LDAKFTADIKELGFETNRKDVSPTMAAIILSMGFDTKTMEYWITADKAKASAEICAQLQVQGRATRREIAEVVGKLMWWDPAIFNVKLLSRCLQRLTGGVHDKQDWDEVVPLSAGADRELRFWRDNVVLLAERRKPMILPRPAELQVEWANLCQGGLSTLNP